MSEKFLQVADCPNCHAKQHISLYTSLNVTVDPDKKQDVLNGRINQFTCSSCKEVIGVDTPLLYVDMNMKFSVMYVTPSEFDSPEFFTHLEKDSATST